MVCTLSYLYNFFHYTCCAQHYCFLHNNNVAFSRNFVDGLSGIVRYKSDFPDDNGIHFVYKIVSFLLLSLCILGVFFDGIVVPWYSNVEQEAGFATVIFFCYV